MTPLAAPGEWLGHVIQSQGLGLGLAAVFLGGLALNLTPCVYPMLPVTLAFFSQQAGGVWRHRVLLAASYVTGIALCYAVLGLAAARTGALFGSWLQSPAVLIWIALAIVALALSMFGLYEIQLPQAISRRLGRASTGVGGAFVMGLTVGVVAAPCVGPFLVGLLLVITQMQNPVAGFLLFFALGLGMGVPSFLLALAAGRIQQWPKAGAWLIWSKKLLGVVLIGVALFMMRPLLSGGAMRAALALWLLGGAAYLGWLERTRAGARLARVRWATGALLGIAALAVLWPSAPSGPGVAWQPYSPQALEAAAQQGRPAMIDVYADWCLPCVELDHVTFRHAGVVQALGGVTTLRLDITRGASPEAEALFKRYQVYGVPTVLLFDAQGRERQDLRLIGFVKPDEFLQRLEALRSD